MKTAICSILTLILLTIATSNTNPTSAQTNNNVQWVCLGNCPNVTISPTIPTSQQQKETNNTQNYGGNYPSTTIQPCNATYSQDDYKHRAHHRGTRNNGFLDFLMQLLQWLLSILRANISGMPSIPTFPNTSPNPCQSPIPQITISPNLTQSPTQPTANPTTQNPSPSTTAPSPTNGNTNQPITDLRNNIEPITSNGLAWSGYTFTYKTLTPGDTVTSTFNVPASSCSNGQRAQINPWPGIQGNGGNDGLAQVGIEIDCNRGVTAWTEAYPAAVVYLNNPVKAGDTITGTVTYQSPGKFTTTISNKEQGWSVDTPMSLRPFSEYQPEILNETQKGSAMKFDQINYTNTIIMNGQQVSLGTQPNLRRSSTNQILTSPLTGSDFSQTYTGQ